jgi:hypothetical protein
VLLCVAWLLTLWEKSRGVNLALVVGLALRTVASCLRSKKLASQGASREEGGASMDFNEKVLYHQIHPAKLAADVSGSIGYHLPDVASEVRLGHARCVRARCPSLRVGY